MAKDIFDQIIEALEQEQHKKGTACVAENVLREFFTNPANPAAAQPAKHKPEPRSESGIQVAAPAPSPAPDLSAVNMEQMCEAVNRCQLCPLGKTRNKPVFGEGDTNADVMFIGEGPGYDEDQQGRPFVGKAGVLLTKMIAAMQLSRETVYIGNIVKCRPPNNRNPLPEEAASCMPYLLRQIEIIQPKVIILLGAVPLKHLLNKTGITRQRGIWGEFRGIKVMPTFHPAFLLRKESAKRDAWNDLKEVMRVLGIKRK